MDLTSHIEKHIHLSPSSLRHPLALVWYLKSFQETCLVLLLSTGELANIYFDSRVKPYFPATESF